MIKKTIEFTNYLGEEESEEFYFNLSQGELTLMQLSAIDQNTEGFDDKLNKIAKGLKGKELAKVFEEMVELSYGEKSTDGKRFIKSPELFAIFKSTGAYSKLITELISNHDFAIEFVNGLMPADLKSAAQKDTNKVLSARERSEANMKGFQKKVDPEPKVEIVPELPTESQEVPVNPEVPSQVKDLSSMSREELIAHLQSTNA
jgi:hypothetical protein